MFSLSRWWNRHRLQVLLAGGAIAAAVLLRQTGGGVFLEVYQVLSRPFQGSPEQEQRLQDARFQELQQRLTELQNQNERLQSLLNYSQKQSAPGITAPVIGRSADHWWHQVILGRGRDQGIQIGDMVTAPGGLAGRVVEVTGNTSTVLLVSDPSSRVGAMVSRTRAMGVLRGVSSDRAVLEFFEKLPGVRKGDVITTSPFSQYFPVGVPIGRVESLNMNKSPAPEVVVRLTVPIASLEWVVVYPRKDATAP